MDGNRIAKVILEHEGSRGRALQPPEPSLQLSLGPRDEAAPLGLGLGGGGSDGGVLRDEEEGAAGDIVLRLLEQRLRELRGGVDQHLRVAWCGGVVVARACMR